ncbi:TPA: hypothetical protein DIU27_01715 [Candidatus Collierbacteria bacterium]|uniref:ChsH2 C-terminal OB-fold domain-containing protein n=1 Tax=Candidatus Collierbacteria bacterium GW2011_GWB2_44_22 TaxID=1618387 RepID=A0A0G1HW82_9BACT|nr:MAG: hypothetical protein UW31_C0012G0005 [Candidatus Collierbacteria bacterium GW2011_GWA2_44_13]KKT51180.1 MAG: hypothetical protein UW44_C0015G0051 [Candidatus Collierbacteria bacterium GW2011_GWB2_44_22]KKT61265.1 MAG: hypothetical protein UW56_C0029G0005 [Candidatus Collierbacteria bacterium GW2011_GWD1_44_27]KKT65983.1 MAG: hypothetical protein UW58_C0015G0005 [Candidatus Collierbacteria bacterium GW2011_GWC2_44_30]KKT68254.1 MAG: hypothetical protein UW64_C0025G0005 [Microgenomates gr
MEKYVHRGDEVFSFSGQGEVYSFTIVYEAPSGFEQFVPYAIALVKLKEGPLITAQLTDIDLDAISIGMPVEMVTRKLSEDGDRGLINYGYKFRPQMK